jgi:multidrug efflux pump
MIGPNLSEWAVKRRPLIVYFMIAALVAGSFAFVRLGRNEDPAFTVRTMVVQAAWPGATLDDTVLQVTERIERRLQEVPGLDYLTSYTRPGVTTIFVNLRGDTPAREVPDRWYDVRKKVGDIRQTLPSGVVGPGFNDEFGDVFGIIYGFTADGFTKRELRDYVEDARSRLLQVPDVSKIDILGAQDEQIFLEFSTQRLAALGLDYPALVAALQAQNAVRPAGVVQTGDEKISLRVSGAFDSEQDLLDVNFVANGRTIRLGDIAEVRRAYADPPQPMFRVDGKPAIGLAIAMREGGDILALGRNIKQAIAQIQTGLPIGIEPVLVADQAVTVDHAINEFTTSLWQAILIIIAVSFVSLGVRPGAVVALSIPLTLAIVFPIMEFFGIDLQRISLGALIIALTLLVDDAMTTVDAMIRRLAAGDSKEGAATFAYRSLAAPMLTGTLVTIAGFVPIGFAASSAGEYTFSIFAVVGISLIVSWFVAVIFAPLIGMAVLKAPKDQGSGEPGRIMRAYRGFLIGAMRARWLTILITIGLFGAALVGTRLVPQQFFPSSDRPELMVNLSLPHNASIYASETVAERLDGVLKGDPDVDRWSIYVGQGAIRFYLPLDVQLPNDFFSQAVIVAKDVGARERLQAKLEKVLAEDFPGVVSRTYPLELGPPVGWPVQYRVSGADMDQVREIALKLAQVVATDANTRRINFDWNEPARQVRVHVDQDEARRLGLSSQTLAATLNAAVTGSTVTQLRDDIYLIDVVARATADERISLPTLRTLQVPLPNGRTVALQSVRDLRLRAGISPGLAPRPGADAHGPRRRGARCPPGERGGRPRAGDRRAECRPAEGLSDRGRRHRRGEREVARLGLRRGPGDAHDHADGADVPLAELPAPVHGHRDPAARPDRRRRRAPHLRAPARLRRDSRHPCADRDDRQERGHPDHPDRGRPRRGPERLGCGRGGEQLAPASDVADRDLDRTGADPDRADRVLGADGVRDHGRAPGRDHADPGLPADCLRDLVPEQGGHPRCASVRAGAVQYGLSAAQLA